MELFYKRFGEHPVAIPEDSILLRGDDAVQMKGMFSNYPQPFCLEVDGINAVTANSEGILISESRLSMSAPAPASGAG